MVINRATPRTASAVIHGSGAEKRLTNVKTGRALTLTLTVGIKEFYAGWAEAAKGGCAYCQAHRQFLTNPIRAAVDAVFRSLSCLSGDERNYATL